MRPEVELDLFSLKVAGAIGRVSDFIQNVVVHRGDFAFGCWRNWVLEDPLVHRFQVASS